MGTLRASINTSTSSLRWRNADALLSALVSSVPMLPIRYAYLLPRRHRAAGRQAGRHKVRRGRCPPPPLHPAPRRSNVQHKPDGLQHQRKGCRQVVVRVQVAAHASGLHDEPQRPRVLHPRAGVLVHGTVWQPLVGVAEPAGVGRVSRGVACEVPPPPTPCMVPGAGVWRARLTRRCART